MAKILAADDSRMIRKMVKQILEAANHEVTVVADGREALDEARNHRYDLVLTDLNMPNMTGLSLASKVCRLEHYENVPVLILTTESADSKKEQAKSLGVSGWITKPFDSERLVAAVNATLAKFGK